MPMWFRPRCPVSLDEKTWIESRFCWLAQEFGCERIRATPVILPTPEFLPESYEGTEEDAARLLRRVCRYMEVDPHRIRLSFYSEEGPDLGEMFRTEGWRR